MDLDTWRPTVRAEMGAMKHAPHERLWWATIIFAVLVVRLDDDRSEEIKAIIAEHKTAWEAVLQDTGSIARDTGTRWAGSVEIDLLHPHHYCGGAKRRLLADLGVDIDMLTMDHRVLIVHAHLVVDCRGHTRRKLARSIRAQWPGLRRVVLAAISEHGTVAANLSRLADYTTKFRLQYSDAWDGKRTRYGAQYESAWRRYMADLYNNVGWCNFIFSHVRVQSASTPKSRNSLAEQHVKSTEDHHQLIVDEILIQEPQGNMEDNKKPSPSPHEVLEKLRARLAVRHCGPVHALEGRDCENRIGEEVRIPASSAIPPNPSAARCAECKAMYPGI
ncbi:hypothetical protein [Microvirga soli]|uniref:hypothetical protein n=1 Tax=Microvirga soli TaxID=1854496 RepID=UPI00191EE753|nr:hypothetical protein [Microvirga soli]